VQKLPKLSAAVTDSAAVAVQALAEPHRGSSCAGTAKISAAMDDMEDAWFRSGVPSRLLRQQREQENRIKPLAEQPHRLLRPVVRSQALRCMSRLLHLNFGSQSGWFKAALLLDRYCTETDIAVEALPLTCVAVVRIMLKVEQKAYAVITEKCWKLCTDELSRWLTSAGYEVPEATERGFMQQEIAVMQALQWRIEEPCAQQWSLTFFTRFGVLAGPSFQHSIQAVEMKTRALAKVVIMCQEAVSALTHEVLILGLLCICMVEAGLVPLGELQPDDLSGEEWLNLYLRTQPNGLAPVCSLTEPQRLQLIEMLTLATGAEQIDLKASAHRAGTALGIAMHSMRQAQQQQQQQQQQH